MRKIAAFDFDGTITTKDTFIEFIKFTHGVPSFLLGFCIHAPILILMKLYLFPNWKAKQMVFSWFYRNMEYTIFLKLGEEFADYVEKIRNDAVVKLMQDLKEEGADIYVISASIDEWVKPFCLHHGVKEVLGTHVEVYDGKLTGRFSSKNCYGKEKVNRFLAVEPNRKEYCLYAFCDSRGDKELLEFADKSQIIK